MSFKVRFAMLFLPLIFTVASTAAIAQTRLDFNLPSQPLADSLRALGSLTGSNVMVAPDVVEGRLAPALKARLTTDEALQQLLEGTGIEYKFLNEKTIVLAEQQDLSNASKAAVEGENNGASALQNGIAAGGKGMRVAQAETPATPSAGEGASKRADEDIKEIIVTAQKREERLQDVPVPVTAISARSLVDSNQLRLEDYYTKVPGLSLVILGDGNKPSVSIRGIASGGISNPTVGIVIDDVPYGIMISPTISPSAPDIDPGDLARVEVLRGPQGTLYGASSLGGLLKFVTVDPSTKGVSGHLQAGTEFTHHGKDLGHTLRGSFNVPLSDNFAVRASAFTVRTPGYIDNVQTGENNVNSWDNSGGRLAAVWAPGDSFSLKLNAMYQKSERNGSSDVDFSVTGDGLRNSMLPGTGTYHRETQAYSAIMKGDVGNVNLTSITGYNIDHLHTYLDFSGFASVRNLAIPFGVTGGTSPESIKVENFTQELRADVALSDNLDLLVGGFFADEHISDRFQFLAANSSTGAVVGTTYNVDAPTTFREHAVFTDLTWKLTPNFDVQFGARYSENRVTFSTTRTGPGSEAFYGISPSVISEVGSKDSAATYLISPRYKISPDLMMYARIASGYRPGSPNAICGQAGVPCDVKHDTTNNYEIGVKGSALNSMLSFDASLYYISWKDMQISLRSALGSSYLGNASTSKSQGVEFSVDARPLPGLTISSWFAFSLAQLTSDFPATAGAFGRRGDRLPYSSPFSGSVSIDQEFPIGKDLAGSIGGSLSYVDDRVGIFRSVATRQTFPSYTKLDLRASAAYKSLTVSLYANNVTDERAVLRGGLDGILANLYTYSQPRTVGLSVAKAF